MNKEEHIKQIKSNISLYKPFTCPDYPELGVYTHQYKDILVKIFNYAQTPYSIIYSDVNKLSVVNERYGKDVGDKTLYTLLRLITKSKFLPKDSYTVRVGGDEFITFVPNKSKEEVEKIINAIKLDIENQSEYLYGSSVTFAVEDSSLGDFEKIVTLAEYQVELQKHNRKNDTFLAEANTSKSFVSLPMPKNISKEQQKKWEILNTKINVAVDNHLRDIRPSSKRFQYTLDVIKADAKTFSLALIDLLSKSSRGVKCNDTKDKKRLEYSYEEALTINSLFHGKDVDLEAFSEDSLNHLNSTLNTLGESLIRDPHSNLLTKSYYKLYSADALLNSNQNYQATYYSMSGIRPRNTAYGHAICDIGIVKTSKILIDECSKKHEFNNKQFTFDKHDSFLIDQGGGNFIFFTPMDNCMSKNEVQEIVDAVNSHYTDAEDSTFKIAASTKDNVNKITIPFFVHSMDNVENSRIEAIRTLYQILKNKFRKTKFLMSSRSSQQINNDKPFVQFARYLKEECDRHKDPLKIQSLEGTINKDSIEVNFEDCIQYYLNEIDSVTSLDDATSIANKKMLLDNIMLALSNHEVYINAVNEKLLGEKLNKRKIFSNVFKVFSKNNEPKDELEEEK